MLCIPFWGAFPDLIEVASIANRQAGLGCSGADLTTCVEITAANAGRCKHILFFTFPTSPWFSLSLSRFSLAIAAEKLSAYGESDIFAPDWFGDASPDNPLHTVDNGRWAFLPVMQASAGHE